LTHVLLFPIVVRIHRKSGILAMEKFLSGALTYEHDQGLCQGIDWINEWVGRGVAWVTTGLVLVVFVDVVMRYLFNTSYVFTQELEWHLFAFIFLMGAGYTLLHDGHVRVDIIYQRLPPKGRAWINLIGVFLFHASRLHHGHRHLMEIHLQFLGHHGRFPDPGGIPYRSWSREPSP
jgi:hypothetical protein